MGFLKRFLIGGFLLIKKIQTLAEDRTQNPSFALVSNQLINTLTNCAIEEAKIKDYI